MKSRDRLAYMANQIARNFATLGDAQAAAATADHIAAFWDPRMKAAMFEDGAGLSPVAASAFDILRGRPHPTHMTRATLSSGNGVERSDAG